jgi:4-amino-4-deoxy-L-arabinose transferase-like glycosyltransferase
MTDGAAAPADGAAPSPPASAPAGAPPPPASAEDGAPRGLAPALLLVLLVAVAALVHPTIARLGEPGPDEFYYLSYAKTLAERGPGAVRDLYHVHVEESRHWLFPSPLRVGYLALAAVWMKLDGVSPRSLAHLSLLSHLLSIAVVYRLVSRELDAARALLTATLLAASPLWLGMSRRALQDSCATLAALLVLSSFLAALDRPRRGRLARFGAAFAFALLVKESLVLLAPPLLLWLALDRRDGRRARLLGVGAATLAALALTAAVWLLAAGSVATLRRLLAIVVETPATNAYLLRFGGGPWSRYLLDDLALAAGPTLLGLAGAGIALERARRGEGERLLVFAALLAAGLLAEHAFLNKNLRYLMLLDVPLRLSAVEALWRLAPARSTALRVATCAAAVLLLAALDVRSFFDLFVERGLYDPVSAPLLELRGIVPRS